MMERPFKLVVAFDGSDPARRALHSALDFAGALGPNAQVHVVSVIDYISLPAGLTEAPAAAPDLLATDAETELRVAEEIAAVAGRRIVTRMLRGPVAGEVLKYAREIGAALIVVGTHGRKGILRTVVGSTCETLVRESEIPVMSVRTAPRPDKGRTLSREAEGIPPVRDSGSLI